MNKKIYFAFILLCLTQYSTALKCYACLNNCGDLSSNDEPKECQTNFDMCYKIVLHEKSNVSNVLIFRGCEKRDKLEVICNKNYDQLVSKLGYERDFCQGCFTDGCNHGDLIHFSSLIVFGTLLVTRLFT